MTGGIVRNHQFRSPDAIFTEPLMNKKFQLAVVARALEHRGNAPEELRRPLEAWVQKLPVDGFRNAIKAPTEKLKGEILRVIDRGNRSLAHAVLDLWMDSHQALRETILAHLGRRSISAPNGSDAWFDAFWSPAEWHCERKAITASDPTLEEDEVALMLCLTSGRFPQLPTVESPLFRDWLNQLQDLPPDADEWAEAGIFTKWVDDVSREKQGELHAWRMKELNRVFNNLSQQFGEDMRYLGIDPSSWPSEVEQRPELAGNTLEFTSTLCDALKTYRSLRPQADTRDEELQRSKERGQLEEAILEDVAVWQELLIQKPTGPAEEPAPESEEPESIQGGVEGSPNDYPLAPGATPIDPSCIFVSSSSSRNKNHSTIWGKPVRTFHDIPAQAQSVFKVIWEVPGITRITLGRKTHKRSEFSLGATVSEPQRPSTIKGIAGKLFDPDGNEGNTQHFEVWVQFDSEKERIWKDIRLKLHTNGLWAG